MAVRRRLVSSGVAARELGVSRESISRWVKQGRIKPALTTPGGQYRFDIDKLRAQLEQQPERENGD